MPEEPKTPLTLEVFHKAINDLKETMVTKNEFQGTINDLKNTLLTKEEFNATLEERLEENTNLIITELSRDIRNADESIMNELKAFREDMKPRVATLENEQDAQDRKLDNHEDRLKKLEETPA